MNTAPFEGKPEAPGSGGGSPGSTTTAGHVDPMEAPNLEEFNNGIPHDDNDREEIVPSYDFQPIQPVQPLSVKKYSVLHAMDRAKFCMGKDAASASFDYKMIVADVDQAMKKHTGTLMNVLEGICARLSLLESRTSSLENSMSDLKVSVGTNQGSNDGKMRQLENILKEVQAGVQVLKDKHEIVDTQLQLSKLQLPKGDQQVGSQNVGETDSLQHPAYACHQVPSNYQQRPHFPFPPSLPPLPTLTAPPPVPQLQNFSVQVLASNQFPQNHVTPTAQGDPYYPPPGQTQEVQTQQHHMPSIQQHQMPPAQQPQPLPSSAPIPQYQQLPSLPPFQPPPQFQTPTSHRPDETPYGASSNYPPSVQPSTHPPGGTSSSQQFFGPPSHMYEPQSGQPNLGFSSAYAPSDTGEPCLHSDPSQYGGGGPMMKPQASPSQEGRSGCPQLPTTRLLPQAVSTASGSGATASSSVGSGNGVLINDVVDRVTNMGFPREHVRETVRRLIANGESVDLNIVLDKLMNDTEYSPQTQRVGLVDSDALYSKLCKAPMLCFTDNSFIRREEK